MTCHVHRLWFKALSILHNIHQQRYWPYNKVDAHTNMHDYQPESHFNHSIETTSSSGLIQINSELPKNGVLSIGGGISYLFSWPAPPMVLPYTLNVRFHYWFPHPTDDVFQIHLRFWIRPFKINHCCWISSHSIPRLFRVIATGIVNST